MVNHPLKMFASGSQNLKSLTVLPKINAWLLLDLWHRNSIKYQYQGMVDHPWLFSAQTAKMYWKQHKKSNLTFIAKHFAGPSSWNFLLAENIKIWAAGAKIFKRMILRWNKTVSCHLGECYRSRARKFFIVYFFNFLFQFPRPLSKASWMLMIENLNLKKWIL